MSQILRKLTHKLSSFRSLVQPKRNLNLLEYQSKKLLDEAGVAIQAFRVLNVKKDTTTLSDFNVKEFVVKAQILAGGRGKGHFDNGFKGGVHITKDRKEAEKLVDQMLGNKLITKQTSAEGSICNTVMVADSINITRETYFCIILDREMGPVIIASPDGGMDIEEVAEKTPEKVLKLPIDPFGGVTMKQALEVADFLEFKGDLRQKTANEIIKLYKLFQKVDAIQIEINPLAETDDGRVIAVDAKLQFDDNAAYRQPAIFQMDDFSESDPKEVEANKYNLTYIAMDGSIGCLVNGAGLAMATLDVIKLQGGNAANFLDVGGNVKEDQVLKAFQIITSDVNVKSILVNVFGGIVNCATIANGIVNASKTMDLKIPLIVRLEGNNVEAGKKILKDSGMNIQSATDLDDAASHAVNLAK